MAEFWKRVEEFWNHNRVLMWVLVVTAVSSALWACFVPQSPGISIGFLALAAGIMSVRPQMHPAEKFTWVAILIAFAILEVLAIKRSDEAVKAERDRQNQQFQSIAGGLETAIATGTSQYNSTISRVNGVLTTTQEIANVAKDTLANLTGGDAVAYLAPQSPTDDGRVPLAIVNPCKFPLTGVTVVIKDMTTVPVKSSQVIFVGTLAPHLVRELDVQLTPTPGNSPPGYASFVIMIYAQNGTSYESLQFRKGKKMFWDYRASVTRLTPGQHSINPKYDKPISDLPNFKFSYGWIEDRPTPP